jgi:hypothetical protein
MYSSDNFTSMPGGITGLTCSWGYKYRNLALQVGKVSNETEKYGQGSIGIRTRERLSGDVHYKPPRVSHKQTRNCLKIITEKRRKIGRRYQMGA